jgi:hypothetical protein
MSKHSSELHKSGDDFFNSVGSAVMRLTPLAAIAVCRDAANHGLVIARVEGGIWHNPGFESRLDCIWDGADPPISVDDAIKNNEIAAGFIEEEQNEHSAFILTAPPLTGWPHRESKERTS